MPGNLTLDGLEKLIRGDHVDTVLVTLPDGHGRLMGKRVTGSFFLDQVARGGMHACAYLLTVDVDMTPLPGYRMASWATGYQDFHAVPDWTTLRRIPWLEKTALVLCDLEDEHHQPVAAAPQPTPEPHAQAPAPPKLAAPPPPKRGGVIADLPKPVQEERPEDARLISRYDSKAQDIGPGEGGSRKPSGERPRAMPPEIPLPERYSTGQRTPPEASLEASAPPAPAPP